MMIHNGQADNCTSEIWDKAVEYIDSRIGPATNSQLAFARNKKNQITGLPFVVAAAMLQDIHADVLGLTADPPSNSKLYTLEDLWEQTFPRRKLPTPIETSRQVSAWIEYTYLSIRRAALTSLKLRRGDIVKRRWSDIHYEVRSIGSDGRVYFRGGQGQRAWPDMLSVAERCNAKLKTSLRKRLENEISDRTRRTEWSEARHKKLIDFSVPRDADLANALEAAYIALESATNEHPFQTVFANHPILLTTLLTGSHGKYLWDRPMLGAEYIPDFVIADVDSMGIHYTLVELESPTAKLYLKNGNFAQRLRDGLNQIQDWRLWLENNISYARTSRDEKGLGFLDIAAKPPGLLIIGRQGNFIGSDESRRRQAYDQNSIEIRSYDGILQDIEARLR